LSRCFQQMDGRNILWLLGYFSRRFSWKDK